MAGTLTITSPATDSQNGFDSSAIDIVWRYDGTNGATQVQRRVIVQRPGTPGNLADTGMQASNATTYRAINLASGIYYTVTVSILDTSGDTTSTTRTIVSRYARSLPPTFTATVTDGTIVFQLNNAVQGSRPIVTTNQIWRRATGSTGAWSLVGTTGMNGVIVDREVRSSSSYDYFARGDADKNAQPVVGVVSGSGTVSGAVAASVPPGGGAVIGVGRTSGTASTATSGGGTAAKVDSAKVDRDVVG